ncbi:hypothetical protein F5Y17DRAFT_448232 [Xylariaceae sp. FL0594]|nr:hypothetical protein F5Y17DRAFT_448232 [Xylariaceae sp. FL0594]
MATLPHRQINMEQPPQFKGWAQDWVKNIDMDQRLVEIRRFGKLMRHHVKWKQAWEDGGSTPGYLHLLWVASVTEVKTFCKMVRGSNRRGNKSAGREQAVEELVKSLLPRHYPSAALHTRDGRPLQKFYGLMLPACSPEFVEGVLSAADSSNPLFQHLKMKKLSVPHGDILRRRLSNYILRGEPSFPEAEVGACLRAFVSRQPALPGSQPYMSASMEFALEMLQARTSIKSTADRWPKGVSELDLFSSLKKRYVKRCPRTHGDIALPCSLGFQVVGFKPDWRLSNEAKALWKQVLFMWKKHPQQYEDLLAQGIPLAIPTDGPGNVLSLICTRWKDDPDLYEHLLVQGLRHGHGGSADALSKGYLETIAGIPVATVKGIPKPALTSELRWRLLRLYCQHVPNRGIDIESATDFRPLKPQKWSFEVVDGLEKKHAVKFVQGLLGASDDLSLLGSSKRPDSIYHYTASARMIRPCFNMELLLVACQQDRADIQQEASNELDRIRKAATTWTDPQDRTRSAQAAAHYAIATGNLLLCGETWIWQHRFLNDSRMAQDLLSKSMTTQEGLDLLSGIPPAATGVTTPLEGIEQRIRAVNVVLRGLADARCIAQKQPWYEKSNWNVEGVIYKVYHRRVSRAKEVTFPPHQTKLDLFSIIWRETENLVQTIGSSFLSEITQPIVDLLGQLSGPSRVTASKMVLDSAAKHGERAGRSIDEYGVAGGLEKLSHRVISELVRGDTCVLAQDMILQAITDHPEASSWHRQFLTIGYMRRLPAGDAKALLLSFATAIGQKLEEQSYIDVGEKEGPKSAPPKSPVKIMTVKYLVNLLNNADFISRDSAADVLIELFRATTHKDVRLAVLGSLFPILNSIVVESGEAWRSHPTVERILRVVEGVIPIAGNINESNPVTAEDWTEAEASGHVPTPSSTLHTSWLFELLIETTAGVHFPIDSRLQTELLSRLVLPTLQHSQEQHQRWFSLFLAKYRVVHKSALNADMLPRVPVSPQVWYELVRHVGHILPAETIQEYSKYLLFSQAPPKALQDFNQVLDQDWSYRKSDKTDCIDHWKEVFGHVINYRELRPFLDMIVEPTAKTAPAIDIVTAVVNQASAVLDKDGQREVWDQFVSNLNPKDRLHSARWPSGKGWALPHWLDTIPPLAKRLTELVEHKKASRGTDRGSDVLPSTLPLRLWCLPYPTPHVTPRDEDFRSFAIELSGTLSSLFERDPVEVLAWSTHQDKIHRAIAGVYHMPQDVDILLRLAVHIGDLDLCSGTEARSADHQATTAEQLIRVSVVLELIRDMVRDRKCSLRKPEHQHELTPERLARGELVERLRVVISRWLDGGGDQRPLVKEEFKEWIVYMKHWRYDAWKLDICSWSSGLAQE